MKRFKMLDEAFICENCQKKVEKLNYTARDHCPYCLYSKHVDINPGDRLNSCQGLLEPIGIEKYRDSYKIIYKCQKIIYIIIYCYNIFYLDCFFIMSQCFNG